MLALPSLKRLLKQPRWRLVAVGTGAALLVFSIWSMSFSYQNMDAPSDKHLYIHQGGSEDLPVMGTNEYGVGDLCQNRKPDEKHPLCSVSFVIPCCAKSGSTALYAYLTQHPDFRSPAPPGRELLCKHPDGWLAQSQKELEYFSRVPDTGEDEKYHDFFPDITPEEAERGIFSGEATPGYFAHSAAPRRMRAAVPNTKVIFILREPASRLYSLHTFLGDIRWQNEEEKDPDTVLEYDHNFYDRFKELPSWLRECPTPVMPPHDPTHVYTEEEKSELELQTRQIADCYDSINAPLPNMPDPNSPDLFDPRGGFEMSMISNMAAVHLRNWRANFPSDQIMVLFTDEIATDPVSVMERVTQFIGLREIDWTEKDLGRWVLGRTDMNHPHYCLYLIPHEIAVNVREHEPMSPDFERLAKTAYLDHVCELERTENVNLTLWKNEGDSCRSS